MSLIPALKRLRQRVSLGYIGSFSKIFFSKNSIIGRYMNKCFGFSFENYFTCFRSTNAKSF
jgi:hypothetical protein